MIHLQWETTTSPEGDAASPAGDPVSPVEDLLASPNFGICDTTPVVVDSESLPLGSTLLWVRLEG